MNFSRNHNITPSSAIWSTDPAMENASTATISGRAWACAIRFNAVASQTSHTAPRFEDQLARFNIWAANLGVFAEAHASLDYRLRNSPKVKAVMMQQLQALQRKLQFALDAMERCKEGYSENNTSVAANTKSDDTDSESSEQGGSISSSDSSQISASVPRSNPDPLIKSAKDLEAAINRLHRLATSIRSSSNRNRNLTATKFAILDENGDDISTQFESFALRIVQARFPEANPILHKRVANLILQRRKMFSYQQRHQQKLAQVFPRTTVRSTGAITTEKRTFPSRGTVAGPRDKQSIFCDNSLGLYICKCVISPCTFNSVFERGVVES
ncbi:hypothetical protein CNMCM7691_008304 [Aspergillus felis]|uniref:Uncharacterized protein n=1 Tax=Aspergillus felis TaxID=1287682 RepID=A0A8H6QSI2_9EURO|nr:hypothetical protein CNMCM7691_008304 [Aspergillus felis]